MLMWRILLMVLRNFWRVPYAYWKLCHHAKHTDEYPEIEKWQHIQYVLRLAVTSGNIDLKAVGMENIPAEGPFLLYGNHQGMFDIIAVAATCDSPVGGIFKKELKDIPFLKQISASTHSYAMDREDVRQSMEVIVNVIKELKKGRSYLIFPEGTRSRKGNQMVDFHAGSFKCALKAKCPVIPVAFVNSFKVLDEKGIKPVHVEIHYLDPILPEEYKDMNTQQLAALVQERIGAVLTAYMEENK